MFAMYFRYLSLYYTIDIYFWGGLQIREKYLEKIFSRSRAKLIHRLRWCPNFFPLAVGNHGCLPGCVPHTLCGTKDAETRRSQLIFQAAFLHKTYVVFHNPSLKLYNRSVSDSVQCAPSAHYTYTFRFRIVTKSRSVQFPITKPIQCAHSV